MPKETTWADTTRQDTAFTVERIGGSAPTQASGRVLSTDRPYYFRARHGAWTLEVGAPGEPTPYIDWASSTVTARGADDTFGAMDNRAVLALLREHLPT